MVPLYAGSPSDSTSVIFSLNPENKPHENRDYLQQWPIFSTWGKKKKSLAQYSLHICWMNEISGKSGLWRRPNWKTPWALKDLNCELICSFFQIRQVIIPLSKFNFTDTTCGAPIITSSTSLSSTGLTSRCSINHLYTILWSSFICQKEQKLGSHSFLKKKPSFWSKLLNSGVMASSEGKVDGCNISRWSPENLSINKRPVLSFQRSPETSWETSKKCHSHPQNS